MYGMFWRPGKTVRTTTQVAWREEKWLCRVARFRRLHKVRTKVQLGIVLTCKIHS